MENIDERPLGTKTNPHYHGDKVRVFFFLSAVLMIMGLPFFKSILSISASSVLLTAVIMIIFAGLTNPKQAWVSFVNTLISLFGFVIFEYAAITHFNYASYLFFIMTQGLALLFLFALYYSVKTIRGFYLLNK
ncbi:MAG TPA: hypothetical protein VLE47_02045 [Candidatus Saccharimonadales bacterium]|nr:hypothetical protein [Candidatus Saccharimonadales bacterium]